LRLAFLPKTETSRLTAENADLYDFFSGQQGRHRAEDARLSAAGASIDDANIPTSGALMSCTFVPPYLLRRLATRAPDERLAARRRSTLELDQRLRDQRTRPAATLPTPPTVRAGATAARRVIHSADGTEQLPGRVARTDDDGPTGDLAVDEAHTSSAQVWDLFAEVFNRPSVDGLGSTLLVTVHYGQDYDNAFWDGTQLVFGDGDGEVFERFTKPMDVMAHEFTHGVTQFTAALTYQGQSGALNESVSDAFASMAKQRALGQDASQADWLIGEGLFVAGINARGLRSMLEPGTAYDDPELGRDPQVGSMADYVETSEDNGGVHLNSGIPNRAFALTARTLGGPSWERAGRVWYAALTGGRVTADSDFVGFAEATVAAAAEVFPDDAAVADAVRGAWLEVGVLSPAAPSAPTPTDPVPVDAARVPAQQARRVAVRRSGGFAGTVRSGELDLEGDPLGPQVRQLLLQTDLQALATGEPVPDRFVYLVALDDWQLAVPEQDLTPELHQVVDIVLGRSGRVDLG